MSNNVVVRRHRGALLFVAPLAPLRTVRILDYKNLYMKQQEPFF